MLPALLEQYCKLSGLVCRDSEESESTPCSRWVTSALSYVGACCKGTESLNVEFLQTVLNLGLNVLVLKPIEMLKVCIDSLL